MLAQIYQHQSLLSDHQSLNQIDPIQILYSHGNVDLGKKNIDSYLQYMFYINPTIKYIITAISFEVQSIFRSPDYILISIQFFFLAHLQHLFLIKYSNNFFTVEVSIEVCLRWGIFSYFFHDRNLPQTNLVSSTCQ